MAERTAKAVWQGNLKDGAGTNPEELLGAAHAACFSMALAGNLTQAGYTPEAIETTAKVTIEKGSEGFSITGIELDTQATVPDIDEDTFLEQAEAAKETCPVSKALAATRINLKARLTSPEAV